MTTNTNHRPINDISIKSIRDQYFVASDFRVSVTDYITSLIDSIAVKDSDTNSVIRVCKIRALEQSKLLDGLNELDKNNLPLFGVPYFVKDNILVKRLEVTAQSKILNGYIASYSADVVVRLEKLGAVLIGQTNMDEFAFGSSTEQSGYGNITRNPANLDKVSGGTSGGSAVSVALGLVPFALGTDTGGSVRQPASFTGVYSMRPTYGTISRFGVIASASSFDQVGVLSANLEDLETVVKILEIKSTNDQTSIATLNEEKISEVINVVVCNEFLEGLDANVKNKFDNVINILASNPRYNVNYVSLQLTKYVLPVYYILQTVEASSNLERFDQVRYGKQIGLDPQLPMLSKDMYFGARSTLIGDEAIRRIMLGTYTSSAGYYDAYYNQACKIRSMIKNEYINLFKTGDVLIMPASPFTAFDIGGKISDPISMYTADIMTVSQPISKLPAVVIPLKVETGEMPIGLQIVGSEYKDLSLLEICNTIEATL